MSEKEQKHTRDDDQDTKYTLMDWQQIQARLDPHPKILVLGNARGGKTHVAAQIAQHLLCPAWVVFTNNTEHDKRWSDSLGSSLTIYPWSSNDVKHKELMKLPIECGFIFDECDLPPSAIHWRHLTDKTIIVIQTFRFKSQLDYKQRRGKNNSDITQQQIRWDLIFHMSSCSDRTGIYQKYKLFDDIPYRDYIKLWNRAIQCSENGAIVIRPGESIGWIRFQPYRLNQPVLISSPAFREFCSRFDMGALETNILSTPKKNNQASDDGFEKDQTVGQIN